MGYEVLDSAGGDKAQPDGGAPTPVEILELADLDPLSATEAPPQFWAGARRRAVAAGCALAHAPLTARRTAAVVAASLLVGGVGMGLLVHDRDRDAAQRAARAVLAVVATGTDVNIGGNDTRSSVTVSAQVVNLGPQPVEVVTGRSAAGVTVGVVRAASRQIAPRGGHVSVTAAFTIDCATTSPVRQPVLSVTTRDRRRHDVGIGGAVLGTSVRESVCSSSISGLQATLQGSLTHPVLRLLSTGPNDVRVIVTSQVGDTSLVSVSTAPRSPVVLHSGAPRDLPVLVTVHRCPVDVSQLSSGMYLQVQSADAAPGGPSTGVDASTLVALVIARACHR